MLRTLGFNYEQTLLSLHINTTPMNWLSGNPLDQGDPSQAGGFSFSLIAFICIFIVVIWALWGFFTRVLPDLIKLKTLMELKLWFKKFWNGLVSVIIIASLLGGVGIILYRFGL